MLELCCGSGYIGYLLKNEGVDIICTDNNKWRDERKDSKFFQESFTDIECIDALDAIEKYKDEVGCILLSWPEYSSDLAVRVLEKCLEYQISMIYIGEDWGGCTADDDFFEMIEEKCNMIDISESYIPFDGIHDSIYLVSKKLELTEEVINSKKE